MKNSLKNKIAFRIAAHCLIWKQVFVYIETNFLFLYIK